jgi:hypothetical protein
MRSHADSVHIQRAGCRLIGDVASTSRRRSTRQRGCDVNNIVVNKRDESVATPHQHELAVDVTCDRCDNGVEAQADS